MRVSKYGLHFRIGAVRTSLVFRYQGDSEDSFDRWHMWKTRELGLWFKGYRAVGSTRGLPKWLWKDSHSPCFMIGLNLIWAKCWIDLAWKPLTLKIDYEG